MGRVPWVFRISAVKKQKQKTFEFVRTGFLLAIVFFSAPVFFFSSSSSPNGTVFAANSTPNKYGVFTWTITPDSLYNNRPQIIIISVSRSPIIFFLLFSRKKISGREREGEGQTERAEPASFQKIRRSTLLLQKQPLPLIGLQKNNNNNKNNRIPERIQRSACITAVGIQRRTQKKKNVHRIQQFWA